MKVVAAATLIGAGCSERPHPWQAPVDGRVHAPGPFLPTASPFLPPSPSASAAAGDGAAEGRPSHAGGLWASCAAGFSPSDDPRRDVERLSLSCGPENGMRRLSSKGVPGGAYRGLLGDDPAADPDRHPLPVRAGACYRIFAVAEPAVAELRVAVVSPRGSVLAEGEPAGRVVIVERDRPFCSFADDRLSIEVRSQRGRGRYALVVYELPAAP